MSVSALRREASPVQGSKDKWAVILIHYTVPCTVLTGRRVALGARVHSVAASSQRPRSRQGPGRAARFRGFRQIAFSYRSPDFFGASLGQVRDTKARGTISIKALRTWILLYYPYFIRLLRETAACSSIKHKPIVLHPQHRSRRTEAEHESRHVHAPA